MSVTIQIESTDIYNIQRAIKVLKLLPDVRVKVSQASDEHVPNRETRQAIKNVKSRKDLVYCNDIEDFWGKIDA